MTTSATSGRGERVQVVPTSACVTAKVWQLPVRVFHWTIFLAVVVLSFTGFYIGTPFVRVGTDPKFLMGTMRAVHDLAAFVFVAAVIGRIIWAFTGNKWSRWDQFIPVTKERRANARAGFRYYLFMTNEPPPGAGHNALAGATYLIVYLMFTVQILTGLAMLSLESQGWLAAWFGWVFAVLPIPWVRFLHHLIMWLTWGFVVHHLYSAILMDTEEKSGLISSIFTGWKRLPADRL